MMDAAAPTRNANPVVLEVRSKKYGKRNAMEWPELAAMSSGGNRRRSRRPVVIVAAATDEEDGETTAAAEQQQQQQHEPESHSRSAYLDDDNVSFLSSFWRNHHDDDNDNDNVDKNETSAAAVASTLRRRNPIPSPENAAVAMALTQASLQTHGKAVSLLTNLGLEYPAVANHNQQPQQEEEKEPQNPVPVIASPPPLLPSSSFLLGVVGGTKSTTNATKTKDTEEERGRQANDSSSTKPQPQPQQPQENNNDDDVRMDAEEIFDIIRNIQDPEHPLTLEQLGVVSVEQISVPLPPPSKTENDNNHNHNNSNNNLVQVRFTPTIPHCSMATQIGLCLKVKLERSLGCGSGCHGYKTRVRIEPGTHASEKAINKQLNDKERVCAALENKHLLAIVNKCILDGMTTTSNPIQSIEMT